MPNALENYGMTLDRQELDDLCSSSSSEMLSFKGDYSDCCVNEMGGYEVQMTFARS